ncbi:MAG: choice-of-anchor D domain-containing protein, partial [bacterium]
GPITGPTTVPNGNQASYSISDVDGASSYSWNYSGEGSISGSGLSIALTPTSSGTLSVLAQNECGDGQPSSLNITVPGLPSVFVNPSSLSFGDVTVGSHSSPQTYLLSASNLTENLIVQASLGFEVSETGSNYVTSLSIVPVDGSIDSKTIYVRFSPGIEGPYDDGIITNESSGESQDVEVTGTGVILPYITLVPSGYDYGSEYVGECSSSYTFTLTNSGGGIATGNVVLSGTDSNSFEIMNGGGSFSLASGDSKDISVIFCPASAGSKTGSLEALGSDETNSASASLSGIGEEPGSPVITATPDYLDFGDVVINSQSVPLSYSLSGNNLDGEITISSDANEYEVSLYQNSGYSNSLTLLPDEGTLNVQIWVIFTPDNLGIQTATISNSSIGATTREVLVSGNGITDEDEFYTIITSFLPAEGGSVHGAGTFPKNSEASLVALPNTNHGFHFYKWVEEGEEDRYENPLAIVVDNNRSFTAHFTNLNYILLNTYSVETSTESDFIQLTVTADQPWVAMPEKDWLSVYPNHGGSGSSEVMVAWLDNPDSEMREAAVVFHNEVADAFFMVKQGLPVSVSELSEEDILVFPNPAQDELKIHNIPHGSYFFITDVQGSEVMRVEQPGKEMFLDISNLQPGFYSLVVVTRDQRIVKKVILF